MARIRREREEKEAMKAEIERLKEVTRRSLAIADERAIEAVKARAEIERLRRVIAGIAEYCSTDHGTLGAISRLAAIRNTADQALRPGNQQGRDTENSNG